MNGSLATLEPEIVRIWTSGACRGSRGPGGWSYLARFGDLERSRSGRVAALTTSVEMEMVSMIQALRDIKRRDVSCIVQTGAEFIVKAFADGLVQWSDNGGRKKDGSSVANWDIWLALKALVDERCPAAPVMFEHIRATSIDAARVVAKQKARREAAQALRAAGPDCEKPSHFDPAVGLIVPAFVAERV